MTEPEEYAHLPPLKEILDKYDLKARKRFGQNFLLDRNITDKIVQSAKIRDRNVFEIGPGPGGLSRSLLGAGPRSLTVVELDARMIPPLQELAAQTGERMRIVEKDALSYSFPHGTRQAVIVANLPYNIATPLLLGWLESLYHQPDLFESLTLMFQKEVAQRITASPGDKNYGRLSVITGFLCHSARLFDIPPGAFTPPPKVTSSVVRLVPKKVQKETRPSFETLEKLTRAAFGQRRKMIRSSLRSYLPYLEALGIDPKRRAETLSVEEFINIAKQSELKQGR